MYTSALGLAVLAMCLAACSARPADIVARIPSNFYYGTKWVLFRDDSVPDPPPNVIQHENNVQVLPSNKHPQQQVPQHQQLFQGYVETTHVTPAPEHVPLVPTHAADAPVLGDYDSDVVESKFLHPTPLPLFKVTTFGVTSVPHTSVHLEGPAYYLRKKKNA